MLSVTCHSSSKSPDLRTSQGMTAETRRYKRPWVGELEGRQKDRGDMKGEKQEKHGWHLSQGCRGRSIKKDTDGGGTNNTMDFIKPPGNLLFLLCYTLKNYITYVMLHNIHVHTHTNITQCCMPFELTLLPTSHILSNKLQYHT